MSNHKILVTGARGFIGSHILSRLVQDGFDCKAIDRKDHVAGNRVEWIKADLLDPARYESHLENIDLIIHAAGTVSFQKKDKERLLMDNYIATKNLVNYALKYQVPRILYISAASTLIRSGNPNLISTHSNGNPVFESYYAKTKFHAELEISRAEAEGMKVCILNATHVLGADNKDSACMQIFEKVDRGISYYPPGNLGLVDIKDLVEIVRKFCNDEINDNRILVNAEVWTIKDFLNEIAIQLGKKKIEKEASAWMIRLLSYWESLRMKNEVIAKENIQSCFTKYTFDTLSSKDLADFKYREIRPLIREIAMSMTK
jgi:dihydroflavonol-4-reductase